MTHAGATDIGRVRKENEDHWAAYPDDGLYIVADGMGGALGGGLASQIVCETLPLLAHKCIGPEMDFSRPDTVAEVNGVLASLSTMLRDGSRDLAGLKGMGSTVVTVIVRGNLAVVSHMGDSRAYLLRDGELRRITRDHTVVELLLESGDVSENEVDEHPLRGRLTRFVGMPDEPLPESHVVELMPEDVLLLCTDGLTGPVSDADIRRAILESVSLDDACLKLTEEANRRGGKDNITAVLIQCLDAPETVITASNDEGMLEEKDRDGIG
jgi:serine/threonine protein phosphatase PrpC